MLEEPWSTSHEAVHFGQSPCGRKAPQRLLRCCLGYVGRFHQLPHLYTHSAFPVLSLVRHLTSSASCRHSLDAVQPSLELLECVKPHLRRPVWLNADILPGPNGSSAAVDAKGFLDTVTSVFPDVTLSLGWTTGWHPDEQNKGYDWMMVKEMAQICSTLSQPVTFPVRAALVRQSMPELCWLIQQSDRYSLTIWTGKQDVYSVEDLLYIRKNCDKSRVYYDILEPQNSEFKKAIGTEC